MEKDESAPCRRVTTHGGNFFLTSDAFSFSRSQDVRSFTFVFPLFFLCFTFVFPLFYLCFSFVLPLFYICLRMSEEFYRLRSFSINKGRLIKLGDSIASRLVLQHIITTYCIVTYSRDQLQSSNIDLKANIQQQKLNCLFQQLVQIQLQCLYSICGNQKTLINHQRISNPGGRDHHAAQQQRTHQGFPLEHRKLAISMLHCFVSKCTSQSHFFLYFSFSFLCLFVAS